MLMDKRIMRRLEALVNRAWSEDGHDGEERDGEVEEVEDDDDGVKNLKTIPLWQRFLREVDGKNMNTRNENVKN
jgi:hypothetical protein